MTTTEISNKRKLSIDQFRGFAIFGMIMVNYLNHFAVIPETFKHPHYGMTFANTIAPFFLIAVGIGFRISFVRMVARIGYKPALIHAIRRYLILIFIGFVLYGPNIRVDVWDALVDIGFAGLLALPFITKSTRVRTAAAFSFLIIYQLLFVYAGYGAWTMANSIDGGPLGPISWVSILLFGTVLYDLLNDIYKIEIPHLTVLGINPLLLYIVQNILIALHGGVLPSNAPLWQALTGFVIIYTLCYLVAHYLWRNKIVVKI